MFKKLIEIKEFTKPLPANKTEGSIASFNINFNPAVISPHKRLGLLERQPVIIPSRLYNYYAVRNHFQELNPVLGNYLDIAKVSENKVFATQVQIKKGEEHFIAIAGNKNYNCAQFQNHAFLLSLNKHIWKWATKNDVFIRLNGSPSTAEIFVNGKPYKDPLIQRLAHEYKDLTTAVNNCLDPRFDFTHIKFNGKTYQAHQEEFLRLLYMFSDLHIGDKTKSDNFGPIKEESLIKFLEEVIIPQNVPVVIPGDLLELWQSTTHNIEKAYPRLFSTLAKIPNLVILSGNHDEEIVEKEDIYNWLKTILPNAHILPAFYYSFEKFDLIAYHGDIADPFNNNTSFGKTVARAAKLLEKVFFIDKKNNWSSAEQRFEALKYYLFSSESLVEKEILNYLTNLVSIISSYMYFNQQKLRELPEGEKRELVIAIGHTHEMIKHNDQNSFLPKLLKAFVHEILSLEEFASVGSKININFINTGAGSGEILTDEKTMNRSNWEKDKKVMEEKGLDYEGYLQLKGKWDEQTRLNGRQNSVCFIIDEDRKLKATYTEEDYNSAGEKIPF